MHANNVGAAGGEVVFKIAFCRRQRSGGVDPVLVGIHS